jgi:hypothetical protein
MFCMVSSCFLSLGPSLRQDPNEACRVRRARWRLKPPETPEGPGWCGQDAARGQHGPALSGVARLRPNRLRGLSVEGMEPGIGATWGPCRTKTFLAGATGQTPHIRKAA